MFTMCGWSESVGAGVTSQKITAIPDEHVKTEGDTIVVPELNKVLGFLAIGETIQNSQLASPSLRRLAVLDIAPQENVALPVFPPYPIFKNRGLISLDVDEQITAYCGNSGAGSLDESVLLLLSDDNVDQVDAPIFTIKATATAPATGYAWASAQLTLAQELPIGTYDLVGARCEQANTISCRFVFIGGTWRPGCFAVDGIDNADPAYQRYGMLGVWGVFHHNRVPSVEFFGDGTGGAASVYLDVVKR